MLLLIFQETSTTDQVEAYIEYLDEEIKQKDPSRIRCLFERAVTEKCLETGIWTKYALYMVSRLSSFI